MSLKLKPAYLKVVEPVPYVSPSQIAFEEAVERADAHTWLGTQNLGHFNVKQLHKALITGDAESQPYLVANPVTKLKLTAFTPDEADVVAALKDTSFYYALMDVASQGKPLSGAYRSALANSNEGYAAIFKQQLSSSRLGF